MTEERREDIQKRAKINLGFYWSGRDSFWQYHKTRCNSLDNIWFELTLVNAIFCLIFLRALNSSSCHEQWWPFKLDRYNWSLQMPFNFWRFEVCWCFFFTIAPSSSLGAVFFFVIFESVFSTLGRKDKKWKYENENLVFFFYLI